MGDNTVIYNLYIHIRSGDIFSQNGGHPYYVQPPLDYYKNIITAKKWNKIFIIYEDDKKRAVIKCGVYFHNNYTTLEAKEFVGGPKLKFLRSVGDVEIIFF